MGYLIFLGNIFYAIFLWCMSWTTQTDRGGSNISYMEKKNSVAEKAILAKKKNWRKKCVNLDKIWPKNGLKWPKIAKIWPKNGLKWPKIA